MHLYLDEGCFDASGLGQESVERAQANLERLEAENARFLSNDVYQFRIAFSSNQRLSFTRICGHSGRRWESNLCWSESHHTSVPSSVHPSWSVLLGRGTAGGLPNHIGQGKNLWNLLVSGSNKYFFVLLIQGMALLLLTYGSFYVLLKQFFYYRIKYAQQASSTYREAWVINFK